MPRWTAYLLWSTRKRREVVVDNPDWTFAQIAKWISEEWKKVSTSFSHDVWIDILLLWCCTRLSCTLIKCCSQLAKIKIQPSLYPFPFPPTEWTNWQMNEVHISKLNGQFPLVNIPNPRISYKYTFLFD